MFACLLAVVLRATDVAAPAPVLESVRLVGSLVVPLMLSLGYALVTVSRAGHSPGHRAWRHATADRPVYRCAGDPSHQSAAASGRRDDIAIRLAGRGRQLHLREAVQHLRRRYWTTRGFITASPPKPGRWKPPRKLSCSICPAIALASVARVSAWQVTAHRKCLSQKTRQSNSPCPKTTSAQTCSKLTE